MTSHRDTSDIEPVIAALTHTNIGTKKTALQTLKTALDTEQTAIDTQRTNLHAHRSRVNDMISNLGNTEDASEYTVQDAGGLFTAAEKTQALADIISKQDQLTQESYATPTTGTVAYSGAGLYLTSVDQGTRMSGEVDISFTATASIPAGSWLSVIIRFSQNHLLNCTTSYDITYSGENFASAASPAATDINENMVKYNAVNSSWTDSLDYTVMNADYLYIRWSATRIQDSNTGFKIAYRITPNAYRTFVS